MYVVSRNRIIRSAAPSCRLNVVRAFQNIKSAAGFAPDADVSFAVAVKIADDGAGVPESEPDKLFDPFYRIQTDRSRETGGAGLGLAIVKTCVESCGGRASAHNRKPHGWEIAIQLQTPETKKD